MAAGRVTTSSFNLIVAALDSSGEVGLTYSEITRKIAGISGSTVRSYVISMARQGAVVKRYEPIPGRPYDPPRCRVWLPKYYADPS
jgi:predicted transcriptional regulator